MRVPHFEEMVVDSRDDSVVMAIPRHHGDFELEEALIVGCWFRAEERERTSQGAQTQKCVETHRDVVKPFFTLVEQLTC